MPVNVTFHVFQSIWVHDKLLMVKTDSVLSVCQVMRCTKLPDPNQQLETIKQL